ncbi:cytochrome c-type biogenesis protein [Kiloniella sp. b19]|uniref:cytochrome c-type biogenesis protein n=1 Tax=Kiloniella sp. GXU_MW_B19 TaxID=3141326 RepID=UPI0031E30039
MISRLLCCLVFTLALFAHQPQKGALSFAGKAVLAVEPDEILPDPALEARAREISKNVRCVVCQNEPIDSSNADIAKELRLIIRERLVAGDSDREIEAFLVARYGDYVLFRPPFNSYTLFLWLGPFAVLLLGGTGLFFYFRSGRKASGTASAQSSGSSALSAEEQAELDRLLASDQEKGSRS